MNDNFYKQNPFVKDLEKELPNFCKYRSYDSKNNLLKYLVKENGIWKDITEIEKVKEELFKLKQELLKEQGVL